MNKLYFGDNLDVMRNYIKDESADLIYLDPPFNSNADYNVLFKESERIGSDAQAEAFKDTWVWGESAAEAYDDILRSNLPHLSLIIRSLRSALGETAMTAYLVMMTIRLIEMRRILKEKGSIFVHCDPTASHYLKIIMDLIFTHQGFVAEIIWKRTNARGTKGKWPRLHDTILHFAGSEKFVFNPLKVRADVAKTPHTLIKGPDGLKYQTYELTGPGITKEGESGRDWRGHSVTKMGRHWGNSVAERNAWDAAGLIHWPKDGGFPRRRDEHPFKPELREVTVGDVWTDIDRLNQTAKERLGYPTQKPVSLLERVLHATTSEGDRVFDPFCGCGTTVEASERLSRQWTGIDVTHYAVTLIETRLRNNHPNAQYQIAGRPTDLAGAHDLAKRDKYQFQWWAAWLLGAQTYETKKGADRGIDANIFYQNGPYGHGRIIISVKGGANVSPAMVSELAGVVQREGAEMGILIILAEPTRAMRANAAGSGFVEKSAHGRLPRIQIATIEDLLDGRLPRLPPLPQPPAFTGKTSKKDKDQLELLLPFASPVAAVEEGVVLDPRYMRFG